VGVIPTSGLPDGVFVLSDLVFIRGPDGDGWRLVSPARVGCCIFGMPGVLVYCFYLEATTSSVFI